MARKDIHVALNGVTGRMGYRQHNMTFDNGFKVEWELWSGRRRRTRPRRRSGSASV